MNAILAKIKTQAEVKLFDLKTKAKSEGKKQVAKYKDKLPNQDQIAEKLGKYTKGMCAPAKKQKLEARYNKLKNSSFSNERYSDSLLSSSANRLRPSPPY